MYVLAIASGFSASQDGFTPAFGGVFQSADCQWKQYAGCPMLALVDVTQTGNGTFGLPILSRVAFGMLQPPALPQQGHAFSVAIKTTSARAYAFVGDLLGKVEVIDVSGTKLRPAPSTPYLPTTSPLYAFAVIQLPRDPVDGLPTNCVDMEIVGNYLYCALARQGIGVIDISPLPNTPQLVAVIDTPGMVTGLSQRTVGGVTHLIVGDSRCGIRIYGA